MNGNKPRTIITAWLLLLTAALWAAPQAVATGKGYGPGRVGLSILAGRDHVDIGYGGIWNSRDKLHVQMEPADGWRIQGYYLDMGYGEDYTPPLTPTGNPKIGHFDYKEEFDFPYINTAAEEGHPYLRTLVLDLDEDLGFKWGNPYAAMRTQGVAIFMNLVKVNEAGDITERTGAWVVPELVTWVTEEAVDDEIVVGEDQVAVADTGELIDTNAVEVKTTKKGKVAGKGHQKAQKTWEVDEAEELISFDGGRWGWWFKFTMGHPETGHFIDSPVAGLTVETPTYEGVTGVDAKFDYFPGEEVEIALGTVTLGATVADHKISPLDIFSPADTENNQVINMARLLQSLDEDGRAKGGINITEVAIGALEQSLAYYGLTDLDFADDYQVDDVINKSIELAGQAEPPLLLTAVSAEDAKDHLEETLNNVMFRKNVSKTPELGSTKAKMNIATVWLPALKANGDPAAYTNKETGEVIEGVPYFDENGDLIRTATEAKPIVITYTDDDPDYDGNDVWAGVSRDDGQTWKRKNLSRAGYRSSFELPDGAKSYGHVKKPVFQVKGNKVLVAWRGTYCRGGKPRYAIKVDDPDTPDVDESDDYPYDDVYYTEDLWGVSGPQRSHDYTEDGFPEVGVMPFAALWTCRGLILTEKDLTTVAGTDAEGVASTWGDMGYVVGDIVWFKPERLTSGRRDVNQIFCGAASSAGFALVWQEDPNGIRPGKAVGPGPGWGGATTSHKTDIWYSYLTWGDHSKVDMNFVPGGDPEHNVEEEDGKVFLERPKALVPMTLPVRLSDNDVLNAKNMKVDAVTYEEELMVSAENLTRCVKFEGGLKITTPDDPEAYLADYTTLRATPDDHLSSMNCTNCHVPYGTVPLGENPTQGAPIPLVVVSSDPLDYLGGFSNGDCVSCHYSHIVPRDRVIAVASGLDEAAKCDECEAKGGVWKDGSDGGEVIEAYYPYEGYPYIEDADSDADGTHNYWKAVPDLLVYQEGDVIDPYLGYETDTLSETDNFYEFTNFSDKVTQVAITRDGRILDGDTGASRANIFLQPYEFAKPDGSIGKSAWAIITYEETKGAGSGPPDEGDGTQPEDGSETHRDDYIPESGKNIIYHSFDFKTPDLVSAGSIANMPEAEYTESPVTIPGNDMAGPIDIQVRDAILDGAGNITPKYIVDEEGVQILDWLGRPQLAYENARRGRFILQGTGAVRSSRTIMLMVYKEGEEGSGRPSDIMMQRFVIPEEEIVFKYKDGKINGVASVVGNPYRFENIQGAWLQDDLSEQWYRASGPVNISSETPTVCTPSMGDPEYEDSWGAVKVVEWVQTVDNLADLSGKYPYDDARAHRGQIRGDFVQVGYSHTANWAAARNGHDKYDFYIRRSFNGGQTFTTKPASKGGAGVEHCRTWTYPSGTQSPGTKVEVCTVYPAGAFEAARNLTQLPNKKESTIEPRIVAVPGTIKEDGVWTGKAEDKQNANVFYVAWGTSDNPIKDPITKEQDEPAPADLYYSFSRDMGETYYIQEWVVNPDSEGEYAGETVYRTPWMAKGDQEQGEVQLRMTPDGSRFYASWLDEGAEGSDIVFRRIMSADFPQNVATTVVPEAVAAVEEDGTSSDDFTSDSGGSDD